MDIGGRAKAGGEFKVNATTTIGQYAGKAVGLPGGGFVVVWQANGLDGSFDGIYAQRFTSDGDKTGPEFRVNMTTANVQNEPRVAALTGGRFVVVWTSNLQDGSGNGVYGQRFRADGQPAGREFRVNRFTAGDQVGSGLAALDDGFVAVWTSTAQDGSDKGVYAQRFFATGQKAGRPFRVNKTTEFNQGTGTVAKLANGAFTIVWQSEFQDESDYGVFGQRYASSGVRYGAREFPVNTTTVFNQGLPVIAANGADGFVVVWQSQLQDGSGYGIVGRRFGQ